MLFIILILLCLITTNSFAFYVADTSISDKEFRTMMKDNNQEEFSNLITIGFDIDYQDSNGNTALMLASEYGHADFIIVLTANGAKVNKRNKKGETALHFAAKNGHDEAIENLIDSNAFVNMPDLNGSTALFFAAKENKLSTVKLLLRNGAAIRFTNMDGNTAINVTSDGKILKLLKENKY